MIAAATQATQNASAWSLDKLPFGWFDVALVLILVFGCWRGRKNGMTKEILPMFRWLATVLVCGLGYEMVGQLILNFSGWGRAVCFLLGYLSLFFLVYLVFLFLKKLFQPRVTGSNLFGGSEYYLGTAAGMIRYACMLFVVLALLNDPFYPVQIQVSVFKKSFSGKFIKEYAGVMLINSVDDAAPRASSPQNSPVAHRGN